MQVAIPLINVVVFVVAAVSPCGAAQTPPAKPPAGEAVQQPPAAAGPAAARTAPQAPDASQGKAAAPASGDATTFSSEQLEQIVAPISLHPDTLLAHILMASTYPLEIVEAARWVEKNPKVTGKALEEALKKEDWDEAVKSLCGFPTVLKQMSDNLDWTQDLGDAFLGQKKELMEAVQKMRHKAQEAGNLKTTEQQKVNSEGDNIVIVSADPEVIYVPTYSPTVVYGPSWYYPYWYYPPMYAPYPPGAGFVAFTAGVVWGAAIWGNCNWGHTDVDIDINRNTEFNRNTNINGGRTDRASNTNRAGGKEGWKHNPEHRKGVNYKSPDVAQRNGAKSGTNRVSRDQARGFDRGGASASQRPASGAGSTRPSTTPSTRGGSSASTRPSTTPSRSGSSASTRSSGSALSGSRSPSVDRSASSRGASSRASSASRGGMSRGGASRGGGGGRRR